MKVLVSEWRRLLDERTKTCPRCGSTEREVEEATENLKQTLNPTGIDARLVKKAIDPGSFKKDVLQSNKILIAGKTSEDWLGAETVQSPCCDACGDAECRTVEYADQAHETIPDELIVKAGLLAASEIFNVKVPQTGLRKSAIRLLSGQHKTFRKATAEY